MKALARAAAVCLVVLVLVALGVWAWAQFTGQGATRALAHAEQQAGSATVAAGQARAETNAIQIVVSGEARDHADLTTHQDNVHDIDAAPGADAPLDPRLNDVGRRGLCRLAAYRDDPECAGLLKGDPAVVPPAGGAGPAPF